MLSAIIFAEISFIRYPFSNHQEQTYQDWVLHDPSTSSPCYPQNVLQHNIVFPHSLLHQYRHRSSALNTLVKTLQRIQDRKSTRLNSSHLKISYAVFCLNKKT